MGKGTKKNRNAKQGIDTMGVSTSEIAKEISKPQTAMPIYESNDDEIDWQTMLWEGKQELVSDSIPAGGCYSFQNVTDKEYTVGIHAEVDENTDIKAFVYDGKDTEPYTR